MSAPPRIPLHVGDYLKDTPPVSRVNWEHHGIYLLALMAAWNVPGCRLPDDDRWLAERFGCTVAELQEHVRPVLCRYFKRRAGFLHQKRLRTERIFVETQSEKQRQRRKSGWDKQKQENRGSGTVEPQTSSGSTPTPTPTLIDSTPPPSEGTPHAPNGATGGQADRSAKSGARGTRLPSDWRPSEEAIAYAVNLLGEELTNETWTTFRDYWRAKAGREARKADWQLTWKTWVRREHERLLERQAREQRWNQRAGA